jgi:hypothetical protein
MVQQAGWKVRCSGECGRWGCVGGWRVLFGGAPELRILMPVYCTLHACIAALSEFAVLS